MVPSSCGSYDPTRPGANTASTTARPRQPSATRTTAARTSPGLVDYIMRSFRRRSSRHRTVAPSDDPHRRPCGPTLGREEDLEREVIDRGSQPILDRDPRPPTE